MGVLISLLVLGAIISAVLLLNNDDGGTSYNEGNSYKWNDWSPWQPCPVTCGSAKQNRTRTCNMVKGECQGPHSETRDCSASVRCPVWDDWSDWQPCPVTCGSGVGVQLRTRSCNTTEVACQGPNRETQNCTASPSLPCPTAPVCFEPYTTLSESYRRESVRGRKPYNCDPDKLDFTSWYRFNLTTGENGILDHCPRRDTCGTRFPVWMNDSHPEQFGAIKLVTMYGSSKGASSDNCFWKSGSARVTKCNVTGDIFYLYQLWRPTIRNCGASYCTRTYDIP